MTRRVLASLLVVLPLLAACGDDANDAPPMTNELGVETFAPDDDPWFQPETLEPDGA